MGVGGYLKETQMELRHVAWPTRLQTIVYTALVIALSLFIAAYLGFFDYIFTNGLAHGLEFLPRRSVSTFQPVSTSSSGGIIVTPVPTPSPSTGKTNPAPTPLPKTPGVPSFQ